ASQFYLFDGLGSTDRLTDGMGSVSDGYVYKAFGSLLASTGTSTNPYRFVGQQGEYFNSDLQQYSLLARIYDPASGRFQSPDPIGFSGGDTNLYRYVRNNPLNLVDPSGLLDPGTLTIIEEVVIAVGAVLSLPAWAIALLIAAVAIAVVALAVGG